MKPSKPFTSALIASIVAAVGAVCEANVISYWRFEEGSGPNAADETGLADGTIMVLPPSSFTGYWSSSVPGATVPQTGQANQYSFLSGNVDGHGLTMQATPSGSVALGSDFTFEVFFNLPGNLGNGVYNTTFGLVNVSEDLSGGGHVGIGLALSACTDVNGNTIGYRFQLAATADDGPGTLLYSQVFSLPGGWNHAAFSSDSGSGAFYLNGTFIGSGSVAGQFTFGTNATFSVGHAGLFPAIGLDEARVSNTALDPSQFLNTIPEPSTFSLVVGALPLFAAFRKRRAECARPAASLAGMLIKPRRTCGSAYRHGANGSRELWVIRAIVSITHRASNHGIRPSGSKCQ
jgi:hypothetical protein